MRQCRNFVLIGLCTCIASGCVREDAGADGVTLTYESWVPLATFLCGLVAIPLGLKARRFARKLSVAMILTGALAATIIAPSLWTDRAVMGNDGFTMKTGVAGFAKEHEVRYADISNARILTEVKRRRRGRTSETQYLVLERKTGGVDKVPVGSRLSRSALPHIIQGLAAAGVPYQP